MGINCAEVVSTRTTPCGLWTCRQSVAHRAACTRVQGDQELVPKSARSVNTLLSSDAIFFNMKTFSMTEGGAFIYILAQAPCLLYPGTLSSIGV